MIWVQLCAAVCVALAAGACIMFAIVTAKRTSAPTSQAEERALTLLRAWLSPEQARQYDSPQKHFEVIGSDTGTRYRIRHGQMINIDQLDSAGNKVCVWCFVPEGNLAAGDCMLAQKIALERFETRVLAIANRMEGNDLAPTVKQPKAAQCTPLAHVADGHRLDGIVEETGGHVVKL